MKLPVSWLREYVPIEMPVRELADRLLISTCEVDRIDAVGVDPEQWSGFAFGCGIERVAQLKYDFPDIRPLWDGDLRVLTQF